jgi:excinuclease ABC subunit A
METRTITVKGAREHNLRNVSLKLPRGKLICFTGVSGSGKSSFAFDTLFAEGQRRYLESLSSYARQFLGQLAKPDVDQITGLSPAIAIQQKTSGWNPRSTVGTITQIHDYLRVLFARVGRQHCTQCGRPISAQTQDQIVARMMQLGEGSKVVILAPVVRGQKGEYRDLFEDLLRQGYARARVDGEIVSLSEPPALGRHVRHDIEIVIDRLTITASSRARLAEAVENALKRGGGTLIVQWDGEAPAEPVSSGNHRAKRKGLSPRRTDLLMSSQYACVQCNIGFESPSPQLFSFNSPAGMCLRCDGLGETFDFDLNLLVTDPRKTFLGGAIEPMRMRGRVGKWRRHIYRGVARHVGFDLKTPWGKLPEKARHALLYGLGDEHITFEWKWSGGVWRHGGTFEGVIADLHEKYRKANSSMVRTYYEKYMRRAGCSECHGARLNPQALAVRIADRNIDEVCQLSIADVRRFFETLELSATERIIAADVVKEIIGRLKFLCDVGLEYLTLARTAPTLSGGESQRIRLASQIGAGLVGVLYVLDEPSIGLHARDNQRLLDSLCRLRDMGNTVIVVEHDEQTMRTADEIVDFGPGPGVRGGEVVAHGDLDAVAKAKRSITGRYLRGDESIEVPPQRRPVQTPNDTKKKTTKTPRERRKTAKLVRKLS